MLTTTVKTLRSYKNLSYVVTVLADDVGRVQLRPDEQVVPAEWLARFEAAERELDKFTDAGLEMLATAEGELDELGDLVARAPNATEILNGALEGELEFALLELVKQDA